MILPQELEPHRAAIAASERPLLAAVVLEEAPADPQASRLGGPPWWPADRPWPLDSDGKPLFLLLQINFADGPRLPPFPDKGLLQVFIGSNDTYGCRFGVNEPTGFACVFHQDLDQPSLADFSFLTFGDDDMSPLEEPLQARALKLSAGHMPVDITDYRFETLLPEIAADDDLSDAVASINSEAPAIRLGGYPNFTQQDPRSDSAGRNLGDFALLTVDTTDGVMWGDSGVAQFLMQEDDLRRLDFSKVHYNWDCF
jgi:uncharacterized protein YwqG